MSFVFSKILWPIVDPANLVVILIAIGAVLLWTRRASLAKGLISVAAVCLAAIAILPLGTWLMAPLEDRFPPPAELPPRIDGIAVLGGGTNPKITAARGQSAVSGSAERLIHFVRLGRRFPEARLAYAGGSGSLFPGELKEADVARMVFEDVGFDVDRVYFDDKSRNTFENALYLKAQMQPRPNDVWLLVTSATHMPRAVGIFRKLGWPVIPYPVDFRTTGTGGGPRLSLADGARGLSIAAKEWVGLVAYFLMGRTSALFPGPDGAIR